MVKQWSMGVVTYRTPSGEIKEHGFGDNVETVSLAASESSDENILIGYIDGGSNEVVRNVDEVVDSGPHYIN
jgi:hypothetical protein